jgi:hypothetical protein
VKYYLCAYIAQGSPTTTFGNAFVAVAEGHELSLKDVRTKIAEEPDTICGPGQVTLLSFQEISRAQYFELTDKELS